MLEFFATSGDFTRRLTSVKANPKFSSPLSGPEDYYSVSTYYLSFWLLLIYGMCHAIGNCCKRCAVHSQHIVLGAEGSLDIPNDNL